MILLLARRKVGLLVPAFSMTASIYKNPGSDSNLNDWYKNHSIFDMEETTPLTKEKHENLHDTSKFTQDFKKVFDPEKADVKQKNYNEIKNQARELVATYLTSEWGEGKDLSPVEFFNAMKEGIMEEAFWYEKYKNRCNDLCSLLFGNKSIDLG